MSSIVYMAVVRANARMKLRVLGTLLGRSNDAQYTSAARQEAHFREAEWDNYLRHGPRGQAEYHRIRALHLIDARAPPRSPHDSIHNSSHQKETDLKINSNISVKTQISFSNNVMMMMV